MAKLKVKKGDRVVVLAGRDKGKTGEVLKALPREYKVIVQGVNVAKRHTRPSATATGGIVEKEAPIQLPNIAYVCKDCKPTRIGFKIQADGKKVCVAKSSGAEIDG